MEEVYFALDAYQATLLALRGHIPELVQQDAKIVFVFPGTDNVYSDLSDYNPGAVVKALRLANTVKSLDSQIHSMRRIKVEGRVKQQRT